MKYFTGLVLLISIAAGAESNDYTVVQKIEPENQEISRFHISLGAQTANFTYEEPTVMRQTGILNGFNLAANYLLNPQWSLVGNINYLAGNAQYDGALFSGKKITAQDTYTILDTVVSGRYLTELTDDAKTSLLFGLGQRSSVDANDESKSDYRREHKYNYLNLAAEVRLNDSEVASTTIEVGLESLLSGTSSSDLSDFAPSFPNIELKFQGGAATKIGITHSHVFPIGTIYGSINYTKWNLKQSEVAYVNLGGKNMAVVEPVNSTQILSLAAGLIF